MDTFEAVSVTHIFRECNMTTDNVAINSVTIDNSYGEKQLNDLNEDIIYTNKETRTER